MAGWPLTLNGAQNTAIDTTSSGVASGVAMGSASTVPARGGSMAMAGVTSRSNSRPSGDQLAGEALESAERVQKGDAVDAAPGGVSDLMWGSTLSKSTSGSPPSRVDDVEEVDELLGGNSSNSIGATCGRAIRAAGRPPRPLERAGAPPCRAGRGE